MERAKKIKTKFPGIRYREHQTRKHGVQKDRYFFIRYKLNGKDKEEGLGWASEGWSAIKANEERSQLMKNKRTGNVGPKTLQEKREIEQTRIELEEQNRAQAEIQNITFHSFFEDTYFPVAQTRKKQGTYEKELQHFNLWLNPLLGDHPLRSITESHLQKIIKAMTKAKLSIRYKEYVLSTFRIVWKMARDRGLVIGAYPGEKIKLPKSDNGRVRFLTHEEAEMLLEGLMKRNTDMHDMTLLSLHTGARAKEVFNLTWECVDMDQGTILLKDTKSGKNRYAYMTNEVKMMFSRRTRKARNALIFKNGRGNKVKETPQTFRTVVNELGLNDNVDDPRHKVVFHTCRHTFGSWHAQSGTPPSVLKELMGHSTVKVTERYSHVSAKHLRQAMVDFEKLGNEQKDE